MNRLLPPLFAVVFGVAVSEAPAAQKDYWVCVNAAGVRAAQDRPCDPGHQTLSSPPGAQAEPRSTPAATSSAQQRSAITPHAADRQVSPHPPNRPDRANPFQPIVDVVWKGAAWMIGLFVVIAAGKVMIGTKRRRKSPWQSTPEYRPPGTTIREAPTVSVEPTPSRLLSSAPSTDLLPTKPTAWNMDLLRSLEWKRFEELCERFWVLKGYPARLTTAGADGGVDVVIPDQRDASKVFAVAQCKSWVSKQVGVEPVRALWGSKDHFKATLALFYGLSGFTDDAKAFAHGKHLKLISGEELLDQIHSLPDSDKNSLLGHVTRGDFTTPTCPACDIKMVRRSGKSGKPDFWGCERFRRCGAQPIPMRS